MRSGSEGLSWLEGLFAGGEVPSMAESRNFEMEISAFIVPFLFSDLLSKTRQGQRLMRLLIMNGARHLMFSHPWTD